MATSTKTRSNAKTKTTRSRKSKGSDLVTLSSVYAVKASRLNIDTTRAAKLVRGRMRSNFAKVCELSPNVKDHKQAANDRKPWPKQVTRDLAAFVLGEGQHA